MLKAAICARADGATSSATRAAGSISRGRPCAPRCALKKDGDRRPRCAPLSSKPPARKTQTSCCTSSTPRSGPARALPAAVRRELWSPGEPVRVAYIGGVFRSELVRERFCSLVEAEPGSRCSPPELGPAAGALLEAYRAAGLAPKLSNLPECKA